MKRPKEWIWKSSQTHWDLFQYRDRATVCYGEMTFRRHRDQHSCAGTCPREPDGDQTPWMTTGRKMEQTCSYHHTRVQQPNGYYNSKKETRHRRKKTTHTRPSINITSIPQDGESRPTHAHTHPTLSCAWIPPPFHPHTHTYTWNAFTHSRTMPSFLGNLPVMRTSLNNCHTQCILSPWQLLLKL